MGTGNFFPEVKWPGNETDHCTPSSTVQWLRMRELPTCFPYVPSCCA